MTRAVCCRCTVLGLRLEILSSLEPRALCSRRYKQTRSLRLQSHGTHMANQLPGLLVFVSPIPQSVQIRNFWSVPFESIELLVMETLTSDDNITSLAVIARQVSSMMSTNCQGGASAFAFQGTNAHVVAKTNEH